MGIQVADPGLPKDVVLRWFQSQCRYGIFNERIRTFAASQAEELDPKLVRVIEVNLPRGLQLAIPFKMFERECADRPLESEVVAWLNPESGEIERTLG